MKPVYQTKLSFPDGDCLSACIASILEVPLEEVPLPDLTVRHWAHRIDTYLAGIGKCFIKWDVKRCVPDYVIRTLVYDIPGNNFGAHAVVQKGDEIVHDPHPDQPHRTLRIEWEYYMQIVDL